MAVNKQQAKMHYVDSNGNQTILYPVNRVEDVEGLEERLVQMDGKKSTLLKVASATLPAAGWSGNVQTVTVEGIPAQGDNAVVVSPEPGSHRAYCQANVRCKEQSTGKLVFACDSTPTQALTVHVLILEKGAAV